MLGAGHTLVAPGGLGVRGDRLARSRRAWGPWTHGGVQAWGLRASAGPGWWQRAPRATPASCSVAWSLAAQLLRSLSPAAVRAQPACGPAFSWRRWGLSVRGSGRKWFSSPGIRAVPPIVSLSCRRTAPRKRALKPAVVPETCVARTWSRLVGTRPAQPCASPGAAADAPVCQGGDLGKRPCLVFLVFFLAIWSEQKVA